MMNDLSFSEKLKVLVDVSSSSGICIATIFILIFMAFMFLTTSKKNAKSSKKFYIGIYSILIGVIVINYYGSLSGMFDYMMNNFFIVFYFPNLAIYLFAIIMTNIILFSTIFNFKEDRLLKYINTTVYSMIHYLLVLILNVVTKNKLDVFDQASIYKCQESAALISLTSVIFMTWIIFIIIYKMIRKSQKKKLRPKRVRVPVREVVTYKKKLPSNFKSITSPTYVNAVKGNKKMPTVTDITNQSLLQTYDNMFTLEDYKKVLDVLKGSEEKQQELKPVIPVEDFEKENKPYIVSTRVIASDEDLNGVEQPKLEELLNLKSI